MAYYCLGDGTTRTKKYEELSVAEKLQADYDLKATNIVLQGLPSDVYAIVNHHKVGKEIWDRVNLLVQGTTLSLQERECKLYDEFDTFLFVNGDDLNVCFNKAMAFLSVVAASRVTVQQVQGWQGKSYAGTGYMGNATSSGGNNIGGQARVVKCYNCQGEGHMARQCTQSKRLRNTAWFKDKAMLVEAQESGQILDEEQLTEDLDAYDSDCDDVSNAKAVLLANLFNYGSDVISEVPHSKPYHNAMDNQSVHAMQDFKQTPVVDFPDNEITNSMILSVIEQMSEQMINHVNNWEKANQEKNSESLTAELERYKERPTLYDGSVISSQHAIVLVIDDEETLILEEAPRELPKVSLVNTSLKKLKYHLGKFDTVVKKRITPDAITEDEWGFEHTKAVFLNEIIPFLKTLKDIFNVFDKDLLEEITEVQTVFNQMEAVVQQCFVDKQCFEIHKKELFLDNDRLLHQIMSQDVMLCVMNSTTVVGDYVNVEMQSSESCNKCFDLDAEL
ncbi:retrovirus-related pol polyprotein from transposon TNT 1-94 [Tanacetum coccineum]